MVTLHVKFPHLEYLTLNIEFTNFQRSLCTDNRNHSVYFLRTMISIVSFVSVTEYFILCCVLDVILNSKQDPHKKLIYTPSTPGEYGSLLYNPSNYTLHKQLN